MARTVLGLFAITTVTLLSPALGQNAPPLSASPDQSPTLEMIDQRGTVMDAPLIGPPDSQREPRNDIVVTAPCSSSAEQGLLSGSYIIDEERSDNVMRTLNSGVRAMSPSVFRSHFSRRLRKASAPVYAVRILFAEGRFWLKNDAKRKIVVPTNGEPIEWTEEDGQVFDVSAQVDGEAIALTFDAVDDSERTTVYCSDGQRLFTQTTISSPLLSTPIRYRVVYNRVADSVSESDFFVHAGERPSYQSRMPLHMRSQTSALRQARS